MDSLVALVAPRLQAHSREPTGVYLTTNESSPSKPAAVRMLVPKVILPRKLPARYKLPSLSIVVSTKYERPGCASAQATLPLELYLATQMPGPLFVSVTDPKSSGDELKITET